MLSAEVMVGPAYRPTADPVNPARRNTLLVLGLLACADTTASDGKTASDSDRFDRFADAFIEMETEHCKCLVSEGNAASAEECEPSNTFLSCQIDILRNHPSQALDEWLDCAIAYRGEQTQCYIDHCGTPEESPCLEAADDGDCTDVRVVLPSEVGQSFFSDCQSSQPSTP